MNVVESIFIFVLSNSYHAFVARGRTLTVAARARALIIGGRYGLPLYLARYASSMRSLIGPLTGSKVTSFVMPAR